MSFSQEILGLLLYPAQTCHLLCQVHVLVPIFHDCRWWIKAVNPGQLFLNCCFCCGGLNSCPSERTLLRIFAVYFLFSFTNFTLWWPLWCLRAKWGSSTSIVDPEGTSIVTMIWSCLWMPSIITIETKPWKGLRLAVRALHYSNIDITESTLLLSKLRLG